MLNNHTQEIRECYQQAAQPGMRFGSLKHCGLRGSAVASLAR
jgi:hypothetical protein